jgi:hypothetical protein
MPENQNATGEHWTRESVAIFKQLGWSQHGSTNFDISCTRHPARKGQGHGIDSFFTYYDPYEQSEQGILVESKCWEFDSITTANMKKWIKQVTECMECAQVSDTLQSLSTAPIKNAIIMCWANDTFDLDKFRERVKAISVGSKKYSCNLYIASNYEILRWCSLINTINELRRTCSEFKFVYPNVPTLGTNFVKADHVTLTHLYSKFIFAQAKSEVRNSRVSEIKDQLIVFCFEKASLQSLEFMYDMIKQLNLQDAQEYIFYLFERETPIRQTVAEFKRKIEGQISGDLDAPSSVCIKYLDVYDGMTHIPDNIINFEEVSE